MYVYIYGDNGGLGWSLMMLLKGGLFMSTIYLYVVLCTHIYTLHIKRHVYYIILIFIKFKAFVYIYFLNIICGLERGLFAEV